MRIELLESHLNFKDDHFGRSVVLTSDTAVLFVYTFKPGQAMTDHTHPFSNEFVMVVSGEAMITVDVESVLAGPNAVVFIPKEAVHAIHNMTDQPLVVTSYMAPKP